MIRPYGEAPARPDPSRVQAVVPSQQQRLIPEPPPQTVQQYRDTSASAPTGQAYRTVRRTYQRTPSEQPASSRQVLEPIRSTVRGRITFYAQKMRDWQELLRRSAAYRSVGETQQLISCRNRVADLYEAYRTLQVQLFNDRITADSRQEITATLQRLQDKDFIYLKGTCPSFFTSLSTPREQTFNIPVDIPPDISGPAIPGGNISAPVPMPDTLGTIPPAQETEMETKFMPSVSPDRGMYRERETEETVETVPDVQNELTPSPEQQARYKEQYQQTLILLKSGREHEARRVLTELLANVRRPGSRTLQIKVLRKLAELEFALRNYTAARILYEDLQQLNADFRRQYLISLQSAGSHREEVDAYAALLLSWLASDPEQDGFTVVQQARTFIRDFPSSGLHPYARELAGKAEQKAEQWFRGLLLQIDHLAADGKKEEALQAAERIPLDILPLDKQDILQQRKNSLMPPVPAEIRPAVEPERTAEEQTVPQEKERETQKEPVRPKAADRYEQAQEVQTASPEPAVPAEPIQETVQQRVEEKKKNPPAVREKQQQPAAESGRPAVTNEELQTAWETGMQALQAAEYDRAVGIFSALLNTPFHEQARGKLEEASRAAGQETRKKAANFFQRANNATDPAVRKKHLLSSKALLEDILQKYPLAGLDAKVKRNLNRVNKELAALSHIPVE
ncbi:MAG: hypothetical protein ACL93V_09855 [Candidatus Electrothrix sp. YB6]